MEKSFFTLGGFIDSVNNGDTKPFSKRGKLRFKINDNTATFKSKLIYRIIKQVTQDKVFYTVPLSDILTYWKGDQYYPDIKKNFKIKFDWDETLDKLAYYGQGTNQITINIFKLNKEYEEYTQYIGSGQILNKPRTAQERQRDSELRYAHSLLQFKIAIFHEIQHVIQEREGIAAPSSKDKHLIEYAKDRYKKPHSLPDYEFDKWLKETQNTTLEKAIQYEYENMWQEQECNEVEKEIVEYERKNHPFKGFMKHGGIIQIFNKKYSLKDLFE